VPGCAHSSRAWLHQNAWLPQRKVSAKIICECVYECVRACARKAWMKSALFIWWDCRQYKGMRTTAPLTLLKPFKTWHRWARIHRYFLNSRPLWPQNLFTPTLQTPRWLCSGPAVPDTQRPSVTLAFHFHKDRHDSPSLLLLHSCSSTSSNFFFNLF